MTTHAAASIRTEPVAGTPVFDADSARRALALNKLFMSLASSDNRARFQSDESAYCVGFGLDHAQRRAVLERDWQAMIDLGASIFYVYKLALMDGRSMQYLGGVFTGMGEQAFADAMQAGGRRDG